MPEFENLNDKNQLYLNRKRQQLKKWFSKYAYYPDKHSLADVFLDYLLDGDADKRFRKESIEFHNWFDREYIFPGDMLYNKVTSEVALVNGGGEWSESNETPYNLYIAGRMEEVAPDDIYNEWIRMSNSITGEQYEL